MRKVLINISVQTLNSRGEISQFYRGDIVVEKDVKSGFMGARIPSRAGNRKCELAVAPKTKKWGRGHLLSPVPKFIYNDVLIINIIEIKGNYNIIDYFYSVK